MRNIEIPYPQRDLHLRSGRLEVAFPPDGSGSQRWTLSQA